MASALAGLKNATAVLTVATTGTVVDATTGNVLPATTTVQVEMFLKAKADGPVGYLQYPGVDVEQLVYDGYVTGALDSRVQVGTEGTLTFAAETAMACVISELRLPYGSTGTIGSILTEVLGPKVQVLAKRQL